MEAKRQRRIFTSDSFPDSSHLVSAFDLQNTCRFARPKWSPYKLKDSKSLYATKYRKLETAIHASVAFASPNLLRVMLVITIKCDTKQNCLCVTQAVVDNHNSSHGQFSPMKTHFLVV